MQLSFWSRQTRACRKSSTRSESPTNPIFIVSFQPNTELRQDSTGKCNKVTIRCLVFLPFSLTLLIFVEHELIILLAYIVVRDAQDYACPTNRQHAVMILITFSMLYLFLFLLFVKYHKCSPFYWIEQRMGRL